jgi:hypothetical protein
MKTTTATPSAAYYNTLVRKTRAYGSCYLHAGMPTHFSADGIDYSVTGYGRSLEGGGHKFKAYAHRNGKIVPTKAL